MDFVHRRPGWLCCGSCRHPIALHCLVWRSIYMATTVTPEVTPAVKTMPTFKEATLDARIPAGPIEDKWDTARFDYKLINPANRRRFHIIVVGSGLAGSAAAATLGEM